MRPGAQLQVVVTQPGELGDAQPGLQGHEEEGLVLSPLQVVWSGLASRASASGSVRKETTARSQRFEPSRVGSLHWPRTLDAHIRLRVARASQRATTEGWLCVRWSYGELTASFWNRVTAFRGRSAASAGLPAVKSTGAERMLVVVASCRSWSWCGRKGVS